MFIDAYMHVKTCISAYLCVPFSVCVRVCVFASFCNFFFTFLIFFSTNAKKKFRVGGFELESVGEPETNFFFFGLILPVNVSIPRAAPPLLSGH